MTYWLDLFTGKTWQEFLDAGAEISGFREGRWKTVQKFQLGDRLLCYLTGISRFVGALEVTSETFRDTKKIWSDAEFPCRVKVKPLVALKPETAIPVLSLKEHLSIFQNLKSPGAWSGHFRGSPAKWKNEDGEVIFKALLQAQASPTVRPFDERKLNYRPNILRAKIGAVTIPEAEPEISIHTPKATQSPTSESSQHDRMQMALTKLGCDLGLEVWVARNDRGRKVDGVKITDLPQLLNELPIHFDPATTKTIELIDVLWLRGKAIVAAFEIESTTSIYSGLLRMSDLIAMQPNLDIPLYIVAPDDRRDKVMSEIGRPTFSRLEPPLREMCKFLPFSALDERIKQVSQFVGYVKPDFIDEIAEVYDSGDTESDEAA
ncbi:MAG: EVE domain-containing protein [Candidatus Aenigmarchaeota archaeon]|nr:EVE domain-containing protein [Candidatus Aenigmarchaeota archaeon]